MKRSKLRSWTYGSRHSKVWTCSPGVNCSWLSLRVHCRQTEQPSLELLQSPIVGSASHQTQSATNFYQPFQLFLSYLETEVRTFGNFYRWQRVRFSSKRKIGVVGGVSVGGGRCFLVESKVQPFVPLNLQIKFFWSTLWSEWMTQNETRRRPKSHCWWRHRVRSFVIEKRKLF